MEDCLYKVTDERGNVIADSMTLENATILLKALFLEYFSDPAAVYGIERYSNAVKAVND